MICIVSLLMFLVITNSPWVVRLTWKKKILRWLKMRAGHLFSPHTSLPINIPGRLLATQKNDIQSNSARYHALPIKLHMQ